MTATILVVDDTDMLRQQMREILEGAELDLRVVEASDGAEALVIALSGEVDVVLSDIIMPNLDGVELVRSIRKKRDAGELPVILVTSDPRVESRSESFEVGVNDYLTRPFTALELVSRIQVQLRLKTLQRELWRANERHKKQNTVDALTGLSNRRTFFEACRRELSRTRRHKLAMSVAVIDIDDLHRVNTAVGHRAGDALIREMSEVIQRQLRQADVLARFDGGKFALLFPHTDATQSRTVSIRICDAVAQRALPGLKSGEVTVSIGLATYPGGQIESVEELMNAVQSTLDGAKSAGGNRIETWTDDGGAGPA